MSITQKKTIFFITLLTILCITLSSIGYGITTTLSPNTTNKTTFQTYPQQTTIQNGTLSGYITDTAQKPIADALIRVYYHGTYQEAYSNETGFYLVTNIPICYCLKNCTCTKTGYKNASIWLPIDETTTHNFQLNPNEPYPVFEPLTPNGVNGWYITKVNVSFAYDPTNVSEIWYDYNGWQQYTEKFLVDEQCGLSIDWYWKDKNGTQSPIKEFTLNIDYTPPIVNLNYDLINYNPITGGDLILTAGVWDNCGIDSVGFYLNDILQHTDDAPPYEWILTISPHPKFILKVIAYDIAGNMGYDTLNGTEIETISQINHQTIPQQSSELETYHYTYNSSGYTLIGEIYLPQDTTEKLPVIVFCEGLAGYIDAYKWLPKTLARQGYIVTIFDFPGQGHSEGIFQNIALELPLLNLYIRYLSIIEFPYHYLNQQWITATSDALTYLIEKSSVKNQVNTSSIGLIGHSYGGITVTEVAAVDDRFDAVVALSQGNVLTVNKINIPIQFQGGCFDLGTISIPILNRCYKKANIPKQIIAIKHGTHFGFSTAFGTFCPCPKKQKDIVATYATGWFDYYLKNDPNAFNTITSSMDGLSSIIPSRYNFGNGDIILS